MHTVFHSLATRASQKLCIRNFPLMMYNENGKSGGSFIPCMGTWRLWDPWDNDIHNNTVSCCVRIVLCWKVEGKVEGMFSKTNHPWIRPYLLRAQKHTHQLLLLFIRLGQKLMTLLNWCFEWSLSITFCNVFTIATHIHSSQRTTWF